MRIAVTGASGFIGRELVRRLAISGVDVVAFSRHAPLPPAILGRVQWVESDLEHDGHVAGHLEGANVIVHLAGRAHLSDVSSSTGGSSFQEANVDATAKLARYAICAGVARFVFVSSVSVYGRSLGTSSILTESSEINPSDPYGASKYEAENRIKEISEGTGMDFVILRPALVVGSGAPGNLSRLLKLVRMQIPLPVPNPSNARSFVSRSNLVDLVISCMTSPNAPGEVFIAADQEFPSTEQVMSWIGDGMGRRVRVIRVPAKLLHVGARCSGMVGLHEKLYGNLRLDSSKARTHLGWTSKESLRDAFRALGQAV